MKFTSVITAVVSFIIVLVASCAKSHGEPEPSRLFMDVHVLQPGSVTFQAVTEAHVKDLAVEKKYGVDFQKFWVDEKKGLV